MPTQASLTSTYTWRVAARDPVAENRLMDELGIAPLVARTLVARGLTDPDEVAHFLNPKLDDLHDPRLLPDFAAARDAVLGARDRNELIYVHGDYDVDGVTSAALWAKFLKSLGCKVEVHVPHRMREGYGVHPFAVEQAHELGAKLFLTCDCGVAAHAQVDHANSLGMRVVVTDHHEVGRTLPDAVAVVNPHRDDSKYPFEELSGSGVSLKLAAGIAEDAGLPVDKFYQAYLDLATLGTVADVMPLIGENRIIVFHGLARLTQTKRSGIVALKEVANVAAAVTTTHIGFALGPRINAAGRVADADLALKLLMECDIVAARELARGVDRLNEERRVTQERIFGEAMEQVEAHGYAERPVIVVAGMDWHPGVVGIVAGKLTETFRRPSFVLNIDVEGGLAKGSARSIPGFNIKQAIDSAEDIAHGGGHAAAGGCSMKIEHVGTFRERMEALGAAWLKPEDFVPTICLDGEMSFTEADQNALKSLMAMEPFGAANPQPMFEMTGVEVVEVRPTSKPEHPQVFFRQGGGPSFKAAAFGWGSRLGPEAVGATGRAVFEIGIDTWNGAKRVNWILRDLALE